MSKIALHHLDIFETLSLQKNIKINLNSQIKMCCQVCMYCMYELHFFFL